MLLALALVGAARCCSRARRASRIDWVNPVFPRIDADDELPATRVDEISPEEILAAGDHEAMLEKRLDDEVRARLELEERFAQRERRAEGAARPPVPASSAGATSAI